ncbi:MAG: hypothetical protein ACM32E_26235 [Gemmatimonadota bacterium]
MARDPLAAVGLTATPQTRRIPGRTGQVRNNAGGYVFGKDLFSKVEDFIVLGHLRRHVLHHRGPAHH